MAAISCLNSRGSGLSFMTAVLVATVWTNPTYAASQSDRAATAILRVYTKEPVLLEEESQAAQDFELSTLRGTIPALLKSHFVIESAIRPQEIAEIPQLRAAEDPLQWVRDRLQVEFPSNSEIMRVRLIDNSLSESDLRKLVNSVVEAFMREVVRAERMKKLRMKEVLHEQFELASQDLNHRREQYHQLAAELGGAQSSAGKVQAEMALHEWKANRAERRRLQRQLIEEYLDYQLEMVGAGAFVYRSGGEQSKEDQAEEGLAAGRAEALAGEVVPVEELDPENRERVAKARARYEVTRQVLAAQIQAFDRKAAEFKEALRKLSKQSAVLEQRKEELDRHARLVDAIGEKLALWNVNLSAGPRVELLQDAVIERISDNASE